MKVRLQFDSGSAKRDFGLRRLARIEAVVAKLALKENITSVAVNSFYNNCTWNRHLGHKTYGAMVSVFVNGCISATEGHSVRIFTEDVRKGRGFKKRFVRDEVVRRFEELVGREEK